MKAWKRHYWQVTVGPHTLKDIPAGSPTSAAKAAMREWESIWPPSRLSNLPALLNVQVKCTERADGTEGDDRVETITVTTSC
jgi:hypothetical protein